MKLFALLFFVASLQASTIHLAVAANVSYAIQDLKKEFLKHHPHTKVEITLGGSGHLSAQILRGAPYDVFMSANMKYPQFLYEKFLAISKPKVYANGLLALFSVKKRDFSKSLTVLKQKDIKKIAIANPKTAPYGAAAVEALKNLHIYKDVKSKFIYAHSVAQTLSYSLKAADIGIVALSALYSKKLKKFHSPQHFIQIDQKLYTPIKQGVVLLKHAKKNDDAKVFLRFLESKKAKQIFKEYGYIVP